MRYLTLAEVLDLHRRVVELAGGAQSLRDLGALQSAVAQPRSAFDGSDLYASLEEKAAALMLSLVQNHPFADGNKRVGHAAAEAFLMLNGYELVTSVDAAEALVVGLASGKVARPELVAWVKRCMKPIPSAGQNAT